MRRASFEKFTLGGAVILTALMAISADASAQTVMSHVASQVSDWVETGRLLKGAGLASALTFFGIKFMCPGENSL